MNGIVTSNLVKRYGSFEALKGVSLSIEDGDLYCLLGPNGAGKSTLIRILTGLMKPTSGEVNIAGLDMKRDLKKIREKVGLVSERVILYDRLTPVENLLFFSSMLRIEKRTALKRINSLLEKVDMIEWKDKPVRVFSTRNEAKSQLCKGLVARAIDSLHG